MCRCLEGFKAAQQIGFHVVEVFKTHSHAYQALANARHLALIFTELAVRGAGRVGEQGFGVAQVGAQGQHLQGVKHMKGP
jgi:hypothetical protein